MDAQVHPSPSKASSHHLLWARLGSLARQTEAGPPEHRFPQETLTVPLSQCGPGRGHTATHARSGPATLPERHTTTHHPVTYWSARHMSQGSQAPAWKGKRKPRGLPTGFSTPTVPPGHAGARDLRPSFSQQDTLSIPFPPPPPPALTEGPLAPAPGFPACPPLPPGSALLQALSTPYPSRPGSRAPTPSSRCFCEGVQLSPREKDQGKRRPGPAPQTHPHWSPRLSRGGTQSLGLPAAPFFPEHASPTSDLRPPHMLVLSNHPHSLPPTHFLLLLGAQRTSHLHREAFRPAPGRLLLCTPHPLCSTMVAPSL